MASRLQDVILRGTAAARPLATAVAPGTLYYSTDTATTDRSDGTTWQTYADAGGGGGGGAATSQGTFAALPAVCTLNDLYCFTDSAYSLARCSATNTWSLFVGGLLVTPPVPANFSWINQGGATITTTNGGIFLTDTTTGSDHIALQVTAVPATPYTRTFLLYGYSPVTGTSDQFGVAWRDAGGQLVTIGCVNSAIAIAKWTNPTSFSGNYVSASTSTAWQANAGAGQLCWLQLGDDGTNRVVKMSNDGVHFVTLHTVGRTDFLTATQLGLFVNCRTFPQGLWVIGYN